MSFADKNRSRPFYEPADLPWELFNYPPGSPIGQCAIFVVHGMGQQSLLETGATLRTGFDDTLDAIQQDHPANPAPDLPPPFIHEGFWADYDQLRSDITPAAWAALSPEERKLYGNLWQTRSHNLWATLKWFFIQLVRLPFRAEPTFTARCIYLGLWIIFPVALLVLAIKYRSIITAVLADVRLYGAPRGTIEHTIVQCIDRRVAEQFLQVLGLDLDLRPLPDARKIHAGGQARSYGRVIWVAHSLGTVVSYNVISDLYRLADELTARGDAQQKAGAELLRSSLIRFVTIGSPLNKIACISAELALRPWPPSVPINTDPADHVMTEGKPRRWWFNFYNVLDPVSGSLNQPLVCRGHPPVNVHVRWRDSLASLIPGAAHIAYWSDTGFLRYVLSRTYGGNLLEDDAPQKSSITWWRVVTGVGTWAALIFALDLMVLVAAIKCYSQQMYCRELCSSEILHKPQLWAWIGGAVALVFIAAVFAHLIGWKKRLELEHAHGTSQPPG